ncbi:MAG: sulfatase-like hydrolase/transferase [Thermoanaerobaculia bacterium]
MRRFVFALLALVLVASGCRRPDQRLPDSERAPVILISIDTLRSDHLPAYGYAGVATPAIDALRRDGVLFERAYSHVPLTLPSHAAIFTGLVPPDNGVRNNIGYRLDGTKHETMAAAFRAAGYATGGAVSAYVLRSSTGIASGFDQYDDAIANRAGEPIGGLSRPGDVTEKIAQSWIETHDAKPFFYFFHIYEPHFPYEPPEPYRTKYASSPYDGEIAASDAIVGRLLDRLREKGLYDRAVIVLLSDHGEGLNDHGEQEHGVFLYREDLQVPLIIKLPENARAGSTISDPAELIDVFPTLAALTGIAAPGRLEGADLFSLHASAVPRDIYSESLFPRIHLGWSPLQSVIAGEHHYIEAPRPELYDLRQDPQEKVNILSQQRRIYASLKKEAERHPLEIEPSSAVSPEEAAKLAALGYLGGSSSAKDGPLPDPKDHMGEINLMIDAGRLEANGRLAEAITEYRKILALNPRFTDAWNKLGTLYEKSGDLEESAAAYRKAIELMPSLADEYGLSLGEVLLRMGRYEEARKHAELAMASSPAAAHSLLGRIALGQGDLGTAEREANAAIDDPNFRLGAMVLLAQCRIKEGRLQEAMQLLEREESEVKARGSKPVERSAFLRGHILATRGDPAGAEKAFQEEIRRFPHNLQAFTTLAAIYRIEGRADDADRVLDGMIAANPNPQACEAAASSLDALDDHADAEIWRKRAAQYR